MLDIKFIRQNLDLVKEACSKKRADVSVDEIVKLDNERKEILRSLESLRAEHNKISKNWVAKSEKDTSEVAGQTVEVRTLLDSIKNKEAELRQIKEKFDALLYKVPNIFLSDVPEGKNESENKVLRKWGEPPKFKFPPKDHTELGVELGIIDIETAAKVAGTRFAYLKRQAALLELALVSYAFDVLTSPKIIKTIANSVKKGYCSKVFLPVFPPMMIKPDVFRKMARLSEEDKNERYYLPSDDLYLIGSAEHTLGSLHMDEIIASENLPLRYVGFSTSFRREAGSYGKDTKGILRVHQFDKVEMESFISPDNSETEQNFFVAIQEYLVKSLGIPYQVVIMCKGDTGKPDARQIDIECWMPGQNKYRETHTSDLMTDYQARRLNTKTRLKDGKTEFLHMNDATVFAIGRILVALIENYQQEDGSIKIPKVLHKYLPFKEIKK